MKMVLGVVLAAVVGIANAQLQARDIDGNGSVDAFYDAGQNLSWLADANHYATLGGPLNETYWSMPSSPSYHELGELRLQNAFSFVESLNIGGVMGWRLPERLIPAGDPTGTNPLCGPAGTTCWAGGSWTNELENMLVNNAGAINSFLNVMSGSYMAYGAPAQLGANDYVSWINPHNPTSRFTTDETSLVWGYVWAVHDGDVGGITAPVTPVPEPQTYALMLAGLLGLGIYSRRRSQASGSTGTHWAVGIQQSHACR